MKAYFRQTIRRHRTPLLILLGTWGVYFTALFSRIMNWRPDGLYFGHENVWSDWAFHVGMANIFATKSPLDWFAYHPMYAGGKFTYPFLTNLISGLLMRVGISLVPAFIVPSIILALALIIGLYALFYLVLRSWKQSIVAISLFFLSSGLGFVQFLSEWWQRPMLSAWLYPVKQYSRLDAHEWYSGNFIVGMLLPQRAFLLGMAMAVWSLVGLIWVLRRPHAAEKYKYILVIAGLLAGLLPIAHMHSFIATVIIAGAVISIYGRQWRLLSYYVLPAGLVAGLLYAIFIRGGIENTQFLSWFPGWTLKGGVGQWLAFWLIAWGAMLPLALVGWWMIRTERLAGSFFAAFFGLFILANLVLFQPVHWDNSKIFMWAYLGFAGLASFVLAKLWRRNLVTKVVALILAVGLTFTGVLELIRLQRIDKNTVLETSTDDIQLGLQLRHTDPRAIFLTAPSHNHLVMMWAARPILLGYTAWAYNYGFNYQQREQDVATMYEGDSEADRLLKYYHVSYVAIGPTELHDLLANEPYFAEHFPIAFQNKDYRIYDVRSLLK